MSSSPSDPPTSSPSTSHPPTTNPPSSSKTTLNPSKKRNAFTALMSPSPKPAPAKPPSPSPSASTTTFHGRNSLGAYIASPETYPPTCVLTHTPATVTIHDLFPKSTIHLLLLPRDPQKTLVPPTIALSDATFLATIKPEIDRMRLLVAKELKRRFGSFSALEKARDDAIAHNESLPPDATPIPVPPGRDYSLDVRAGIHAVPSMTHLHIHIVTRDSVSPCMKHRKHYNSFHTPFFVDVEDFPLEDGGERVRKGGFLRNELVCWRCGRGFGRGFQELKRHLEGEFEEWKRV